MRIPEALRLGCIAATGAQSDEARWHGPSDSGFANAPSHRGNRAGRPSPRPTPSAVGVSVLHLGWVAQAAGWGKDGIAADDHLNDTTRRPTMTTNIKLKLIGLLTTVALVALPVAEASAHTSW
jgi:hypothetical protein